MLKTLERLSEKEIRELGGLTSGRAEKHPDMDLERYNGLKDEA